jgi:hypothetical protein
MGVVSGEMGVGSWEWGVGSGKCSGLLVPFQHSLFVVHSSLFYFFLFNHKGHKGVTRFTRAFFCVSNYSFMNLNLLLRNPAYTNLYDLYV